jgi:hypothetical protein
MTKKVLRSRKQKEVKKLTIPVKIGSDHIRGSANNNSPITLVEYGDYECPYTGMAYPIVKELIRELVMTKYVLCSATFLLMRYTLMLNMQLKQQRLPQLKINSGRCMIIYLNIRKH